MEEIGDYHDDDDDDNPSQLSDDKKARKGMLNCGICVRTRGLRTEVEDDGMK